MRSAKNSGAQRRVVSSHRVALAPFSQNSNGWVSAGFVHEQETHMKPCGLFCRASVSIAADVAHSEPKILVMPLREPQPPAGPS